MDSWVNSLGQMASRGMRKFADASHAMPPDGPPSLHRLYNALGMIAFWVVGRKLIDIMTAHTSKGEEIKAEDVPGVLRPLHGIIHYNPYGDGQKDKTIHLFSQFFPAICGAVGAIMGTNYFFMDRNHKIAASLAGEAKDFSISNAASAASMAQSKPLKILAGVFAIFGSASGLTALYGFFLNNTFVLGQGRKISTMTGPLQFVNNTASPTPFGPEAGLVALKDRLTNSNGRFTREMEEKFAAFGSALGLSKEEVPEAVQKFKAHVLQTVEKMNAKHGAKTSEELTKEFEKMLNPLGVEETLTKLGLFDPKKLKPSNNGFLGWLGEKLGAQKEVDKILAKLHEGIQQRHPGMGI